MENMNIEEAQMIDFEEELEFIHNLTNISKEDIEKVIDADMQFLQSKDIASIPDEEENKEEVSYDEEMEYFANEIEEDVDTVLKIFCLDHKIKRIINFETHNDTIFIWYEESDSLLSKIKYDWIMSGTAYICGEKRNLLEKFFMKIRKIFNIKINL